MKFKKLGILTFILMYCLCTFGCSNKKDSSDSIVFTIDNVEISLEEARFYAYNKQASYEVYYLASDAEINWKESYVDDSDGSTMEELVKAETVEHIKKLVIMSEYAKNEGITLSNDDKNDIKTSIQTYKEDSSQKLLSKISISDDALNNIYTRQKYYDKLCEKIYTDANITVTDAEIDELSQSILEDDDSITTDEATEIARETLLSEKQEVAVKEIYDSLLKDANVSIDTDLWKQITFDESIFTKADLE